MLPERKRRFFLHWGPVPPDKPPTPDPPTCVALDKCWVMGAWAVCGPACVELSDTCETIPWGHKSDLPRIRVRSEVGWKRQTFFKRLEISSRAEFTNEGSLYWRMAFFSGTYIIKNLEIKWNFEWVTFYFGFWVTFNIALMFEKEANFIKIMEGHDGGGTCFHLWLVN